MNLIPVATEHVRAYTALLRLAVRLLAREIDPLLYRQMLQADSDSGGGHRPLTDPGLAERTEGEALEELAAEYCHLFIGPQPVCPPYASVHHGEVKLGGRAAHDIEGFMDRYDLHPILQEEDAVLDQDHLAVELALLAHLYRIAAGAVTDCLTPGEAWAAAHDLLHTHIRPWAVDYLGRLQSAAQFAPYTTIAHLVRKILEEAADWPAAALPPSAKRGLVAASQQM